MPLDLDPKKFLAALALFAAAPGCGDDGTAECDSAATCDDGTQEGSQTGTQEGAQEG
jgi:hypothetical protein